MVLILKVAKLEQFIRKQGKTDEFKSSLSLLTDSHGMMQEIRSLFEDDVDTGSAGCSWNE